MPHGSPTARHAAASAIARTAAMFPEPAGVALDANGLSPADRALATAIHRTTLQRWLTLEHLVNRYSKTPAEKMEPAMRAVLLTGAAQVLFMPGVADYAAVDEAVKLAGSMVRPHARGMTNAVLRKIAGLVGGVEQTPWEPARDRLPLGEGTLVLNEPALPHPANLVKHLPAAASHGEPLVNRWIRSFGAAEATRLCLHGLQDPPIIVVTEPGFDRAAASAADADHPWKPHEDERCIVWAGDHAALVAFLTADRRRRVQDPASLAAASVAAGLEPRTILDYCAGQGTKTRQLALQHPDARIIATDANDHRRATLRYLPESHPNVTVVNPDDALRQSCDLLLLDVPCSNTGVLARRPEARYRFSPATLRELVDLQRSIVERTWPRVEKGGHLLYTTCSIEREENEDQARWIAQRTRGEIVSEGGVRPGGRGAAYHDGSYHALIRLPG